MNRLISLVCEKANIPCNKTEGDSIIVSPRKGNQTEGVILTDVCGKGGIYHNKTSYRDIISGKTFDDDIIVKPYEVMVLEKIK